MTSRLEYLKYFAGETMRFYNIQIALANTLQLLPPSLFWISIDAAFYNLNLNDGLICRAKALPFPTRSQPRKGPRMEGPYLSTEHMEYCSPAYNLIIRPNPSKATKIILKNIEKKMKDYFVEYFSNEFIQNLPYILEHTFIGHKKNGIITGVHFRSSDVRILSHINSNYKSISPFVKIEKFDPLSNNVLTKNAPSTLWPLSWDIEKCVIEFAFAWNNKFEYKSSNNFLGYASDGLKIIFCFRNGILKTLYPDSSNNESQ